MTRKHFTALAAALTEHTQILLDLAYLAILLDSDAMIPIAEAVRINEGVSL